MELIGLYLMQRYETRQNIANVLARFVAFGRSECATWITHELEKRVECCTELVTDDARQVVFEYFNGNHFTTNASTDTAALNEQIKLLKDIIKEKERLISILLSKN